MKTSHLSLLTLAACAAAMLPAGPLLAIPYTPGMFQPFSPVCEPPTAFECSSYYWRTFDYCGRQAAAAAKVDESAACNLRLDERAEQLVTLQNQSPVVTPAGVFDLDHHAVQWNANDPNDPGAGGCTVYDPAAVTCAYLERYSNNGHYAWGLNRFAFGRTLANLSFEPRDNTTQQAATARWREFYRRLGWELNGNRVDSCREYTYEKYYDYSRFEDEVARFGNDPRAVYRIAYGEADTSAPAIGLMGIAGTPISGRNEVPITPQISFPAELQPKNVYFSTPLAGDAGNNPTFEFSCFEEPRSVFFNRVYLVSLQLRALIAAEPTFQESWAWHKARSEELEAAGVLDEELYYLDSIRDEFRELLAARERTGREFTAYIRALFDQTNGQEQMPVDPFAQGFNPDEHINVLASALDANVGIAPMASESALITFAEPADLSQLEIIPADDTAEIQASLDSFAEDICILGAASNYPTGAVAYYVVALAGLDRAIEQMLAEARDLGCMETNPSVWTRCDWAPHYFSQRVTDLYIQERESDQQRCLDYTANDFAKLEGAQFLVPDLIEPIGPDTPVADCGYGDYRSSPQEVERYFTCTDQWAEAILDQLLGTGADVFDANHNLQVGYSSSDVSSAGAGPFGVIVGYDSRWSAQGFGKNGTQDKPPGAIGMSASGNLWVNARAFTEDTQVFSARYSMDTNSGDVDLFVLGKEMYYSDATEQAFSQLQFHPVADARGGEVSLLSASTVIPVLGVPVRVSAGVVGSVGLNYHMQVGRRDTPVDHRLEALVEPYAGISAFASASVDLLVIEAGIKGQVALLVLSLPMGTGIQIAQPSGELQLIVNSAADLNLSMLSGYLAVFGRIGVGPFKKKAEVPVFSWGGLSTSTNLYHANWAIPLRALNHLATMDIQ